VVFVLLFILFFNTLPQKEEIPSLVEILDQALNNRNYQSTENKMSAFKKVVPFVNYIVNNGIEDYSMLNERVGEIKSEFNTVRTSLKSTESRLKELEENIRQRNIYREYEPVVVEYEKIKNPKKRQQFHYENDYKIIMFHSAEKHLKKYFKNGKLPLKSWKAEVETLTADKERLYQEYYRLKDDVSEIEKVKRGIDDIVHEKEKVHRRERNVDRQEER
jgi:chaperonin cofactor prefoldin